MNLSLSLPHILVLLLSPEILNRLSAKMIYNCNTAVQVAAPAIHIAIIAFIGEDLKAGPSTKAATLAVICYLISYCLAENLTEICRHLAVF